MNTSSCGKNTIAYERRYRNRHTFAGTCVRAYAALFLARAAPPYPFLISHRQRCRSISGLESISNLSRKYFRYCPTIDKPIRERFCAGHNSRVRNFRETRFRGPLPRTHAIPTTLAMKPENDPFHAAHEDYGRPVGSDARTKGIHAHTRAHTFDNGKRTEHNVSDPPRRVAFPLADVRGTKCALLSKRYT